MLVKKLLVFTGLCLLSLSAIAEEFWQVSGVESWDTLNIRNGPGVKNAVVGEIPFDGKDIVATGKERNIGFTHWVEISWADKQGWVSNAYLARMPEEVTDEGTELAAGIVSSQSELSSEPAEKAAKAEEFTNEAATSVGKAEESKSGEDAKVASDGMTDLEALSILARPALADPKPVEQRNTTVQRTSLQNMKEE